MEFNYQHLHFGRVLQGVERFLRQITSVSPSQEVKLSKKQFWLTGESVIQLKKVLCLFGENYYEISFSGNEPKKHNLHQYLPKYLKQAGNDKWEIRSSSYISKLILICNSNFPLIEIKTYTGVGWQVCLSAEIAIYGW